MNKEVGPHQTQNLLAPRATHFMVLCYNSPNRLRQKKKITLKCSSFKNEYLLSIFCVCESGVQMELCWMLLAQDVSQDYNQSVKQGAVISRLHWVHFQTTYVAVGSLGSPLVIN